MRDFALGLASVTAVVCIVVLVAFGIARFDEKEREFRARTDGVGQPKSRSYNERQERITVHELAPGTCVALYTNGGDAAAMVAVPCPQIEAEASHDR